MNIKKFEYKIAKKILKYDILNIDREIQHMNEMRNSRSTQHEMIVDYCEGRLVDLNLMKEKKLLDLKNLIEKYE